MNEKAEMRRLEADLTADESLRVRFEEAVRDARGMGHAETMARVAAELGYQITAADFERAEAEAQSIDLDDLASVAGGEDGVDLYGRDLWCEVNYHCDIAFMHGEGGTSVESCFASYRCNVIYH